jgi:hypothetical protein
LRSRVSETNARLSQSLEKQYDREDVLFTSMREHGAEGYNKATNLHSLRKETSHGEEVLLTDLPRTMGRQEQEDIAGQSMPNLQKNIQTAQQPVNVLFKGMCKQGSFCENDGQRQSEVCRRTQLRSNVLENETESLRQGQSSMPDLRKERKSDCNTPWGQEIKTNQHDSSSHRPEYSSQYHEESDYSVRLLPSEHTSSVQADRIIGIERVSGEKYPCYDLQIEDNENFIANNLIVHNCLICDDLVKNANEAYNERVLDDIWNWYIGTFMSRAEHTGEGSIEIINFTR